ncbi:MAG TPA: hypothetical protein VF846_05895 [Thermoanaerobaculia bacterium]|jgi:hypothetical protein
MKKKPLSDDYDPLDREIDFSNARPNPYFVAYHSPKVIRVLERDLADIFPDNDSVNAALRSIANAAQQTAKKRISAKRVTAIKAPVK